MGKIEISACELCAGNCMKCGYSDVCPSYQDISTETATVTFGCAKVALCESRHEMPNEVEGSIFPNTIDPVNIGSMRVQCARSLSRFVLQNGYKYLVVYVTGLTVALVEVINWCIRNKVNLTLMHYDRSTGKYYRQDVA